MKLEFIHRKYELPFILKNSNKKSEKKDLSVLKSGVQSKPVV